MKTIFYLIALVAASFFITSSGFAQYRRGYNDGYKNDTQQAFYYYPQSNVYFSLASDKYISLYRNAWLVSERAPRNIRRKKEPYVVVYHRGFDVWNDNRYHVLKYKDNRRWQPDMVYAPSNKNGIFENRER